MSNDRPKPTHPVSIGYRPGISKDSRNDLGYGLSKNKFHNPRNLNNLYPYHEEDEGYDDPEILDFDILVLQKIYNKISTPGQSFDPLIKRSKDAMAYVSGNRPLSLSEIMTQSLVPIPDLYKSRTNVGGGTVNKMIRPGQYNRTGTYRGWSHANQEDYAELSFEEYSNSEDPAVERAKKIIKKNLKKNLEEL